MKKLFLTLLLPLFSYGQGPVTVTEAKVFLPVKGAQNTAAYAIFKNDSATALDLTVKSFEPFKKIETHVSIEKDGMMSMNKVEKFVIPANGIFSLKVGGPHIMLFQAKRELKLGEELQAELLIGGKVLPVKFKVESRTKTTYEHHH